jgi:2-isopropylmalate synthase
VHPRHPYAGDLVYTAFSGSHQDAIKKGLGAIDAARVEGEYPQWEVPYLLLDPAHVGRTYEAVIRVNSQSGKGGVAYIMDTEHQMVLPRRLQIEFSKAVQAVAEDTGTEISPADMWAVFEREYFPDEATIELLSHELRTDADHAELAAELRVRGEACTVHGAGNGPIDAFVNALREGVGISIDVVDYSEHTLGVGSDASAVAYVETIGPDGRTRWGVGIHPSILSASLRAVVSAVNGRERLVGGPMPL